MNVDENFGKQLMIGLIKGNTFTSNASVRCLYSVIIRNCGEREGGNKIEDHRLASRCLLRIARGGFLIPSSNE